jgi:hypothetical protein
MSGWVHVEQDFDGLGHRCSVPVGTIPRRWGGFPCGCTTPTPDPASPCGVCNQGTVMCFYTNTHTYQPTRCTCGHPIEPTPGGTR